MNILVLDHETPWVKSLFCAASEEVRVTFLGVHNIRELKYKKPLSLWGMFTARQIDSRQSERYVWVPSRLRRLTRVWLRAYCHLVLPHASWPDVVVVTYPSGVNLLDAFKGVRSLYYVHDPFEFYGNLDPTVVRKQEQQLIERCDMVATVSKQLQADLAGRCNRPIHYLPNAVDRGWLASESGGRPTDMPPEGRVVGCVGQMNATYDWTLLGGLAERRTDTTFVLVGPIAEMDPTVNAEIAGVLKLANVQWLGPKPHASLKAYMAAFDVCLCPLKRNAHNDRRCPLRLYDYLSTDKPVLSTDIVEAHEHASYILIGRDIDEWDAHLTRVFAGEYVVDLSARQEYMAKQTWQDRARQLVDWLSVGGAAG